GLLLLFAAGARLLGGGFGLLLELYAFETEQVLSAMDRVFQRAVGVVELRGLLQAPILLVGGGAGVNVWMEPAAERVEIFLKLGLVEVQLLAQAEELEVRHGTRGLHLAAARAEMLAQGERLRARPALGFAFDHARVLLDINFHIQLFSLKNTIDD